uniref:Uncharacterized protein n=1 Tax=Acrobeloides nanus TaxID=290746 RepID=A0A914CQS6_9BILA
MQIPWSIDLNSIQPGCSDSLQPIFPLVRMDSEVVDFAGNVLKRERSRCMNNSELAASCLHSRGRMLMGKE